MYPMEHIDDITILQLFGEVNLPEMNLLAGVLSKLMTTSQNKIVLNFEEVEHINYKALQTLLEGTLKLRSLQGDLKCASLNQYTHNIFRFTGTDQVMEAYESVSEAVLSFQGVSSHRTWH